jgi:hypothetical protein
VFEEVMETGVEVLCWRNLRIFAGDAVGLLNSTINNKEPRDRLRRLYNGREDWVSFTTERRYWFRKSFRVPSEADALMPFRCRHVSPPEFKINAPTIVARFAGNGSWEMWQRDGNIIVKMLAGYLESELD